MRRLLTLAVLGCALGWGAASASAETDLLVTPPVGTDAKDVKAALAKTSYTLSGRPITPECASDPGCLTKLGSDSNARRVLSINANGTKLTLTLVDAGAKLLLATRDVDIAKKKLARDLGPAISKFVEDAAVDKAKALFAEGNEHYNLGEFAQALDKYKLAYRVKPLAAFQFNIAQCHRKLGQYQDAIAMYQAYLVGTPNATNKATIESLIAEAKKALADQQALEQQRERDKLMTEQKKAEEARKAKEAQANAQSAQAQAESEQAKTEQARIAAERELEKKYNTHPARGWMVATAGLGLATAGVGGYFAYQTREVQRRYDAASCDGMSGLDQAEIDQCVADKKTGDRDAFLTNVLIGSGGAVIITALIVYAIDPGNVERPNRVGAAVTHNSINLVVRW
jgi:tetratricopeptide (TPR) repeat protein